MMEQPAEPAEKIAGLEDKAKILENHIRSLVLTLGVFHGLNDRLEGQRLSGNGASALSVIMSDQIDLVVIRVDALVSPHKWPTDVTLGTFADAMKDPELQQLLIDRTAEWPGSPELNRKRIAALMERFPQRLQAINADAAKRLKRLRNKVVAHITTEGSKIPTVLLHELWDMARRTVTLGGEVSQIFLERPTAHAIEMRQVKKSARYIIGYIRSAHNEQGRRIKRQRKRWSELRGKSET